MSFLFKNAKEISYEYVSVHRVPNLHQNCTCMVDVLCLCVFSYMIASYRVEHSSALKVPVAGVFGTSVPTNRTPRRYTICERWLLRGRNVCMTPSRFRFEYT
jgi:hypothetical protein